MSENIDNPEAFTPNFPVVTIEDEMRDSADNFTTQVCRYIMQ
jgi:hypothetical protein